MLTELARREKAAGIKPDPDIDVYMKVREVEVCLNFKTCLAFSQFDSRKEKKKIIGCKI